jgi:hypothetical protein
VLSLQAFCNFRVEWATARKKIIDSSLGCTFPPAANQTEAQANDLDLRCMSACNHDDSLMTFEKIGGSLLEMNASIREFISQ